MNKIVPCSPRGDIVSLSPFLDSQNASFVCSSFTIFNRFCLAPILRLHNQPAGAFHIWKANSPHHTQPNSIIVKNMGPVPGVRLWQPRSQGSLLPVQAREPGNKVAITRGRRKEM